MAKIMEVDYEAMPGQAKQMRANGQKLNTEITNAFKSIQEMHSAWYGKRYNELVKAFNQIIPQVNQLLELVVGDIPYSIETIANNYSRADKGSNVTSAAKTSPKKITNIPLSNDVGMKFLTSEVSSIQTSVTNNFTKAKELMNTIESDYGKIKWQSEAADAYKANFKKLKSQIVSSFEDLKSQFTKLMNQTKEDVQATENANTVK